MDERTGALRQRAHRQAWSLCVAVAVATVRRGTVVHRCVCRVIHMQRWLRCCLISSCYSISPSISFSSSPLVLVRRCAWMERADGQTPAIVHPQWRSDSVTERETARHGRHGHHVHDEIRSARTNMMEEQRQQHALTGAHSRTRSRVLPQRSHSTSGQLHSGARATVTVRCHSRMQ